MMTTAGRIPGGNAFIPAGCDDRAILISALKVSETRAGVRRMPAPGPGIKHVILRPGLAIHKKCGSPRALIHPVLGRKSDIIAGRACMINAWKILVIAGSGTMDSVASLSLSDNLIRFL
jgi:hypothetical protein